MRCVLTPKCSTLSRAPASVIVIIRNEGDDGVYDEDHVPGRVVYGEAQAQSWSSRCARLI